MTTLEVLKAARELISNPARWTAGAYARNLLGSAVFESDSSAVCWCAGGAIRKAGRDYGLEDDDCERVRRLVRDELPRGTALSTYNDERGHAAVIALLGCAIAKLEAEASHV